MAQYTDLKRDSQAVIAELHTRIRQATKEYEEVDFEVVTDPLLVYDIQTSHMKRIKEALQEAWDDIV